MLQALKPMYFDLFVQATQIVARYEPTNDSYVSPSFAMNIVNSFKQCCDIAISYVVKESVPAAEAESQLRTMHQLLTSNWRFEISSHAADTLNLNKWNNITIVPLATDKSIKSLCIDNKDASAFNILVETIYCRVLLLNRKRPGELQRMLLQTYLNSSSNKGQYEELKRVVIRGKETGEFLCFSVMTYKVILSYAREPDEADAYDEEHSLDNTVTETQAVPDQLNVNMPELKKTKNLIINSKEVERRDRLATTHFAKHIKNSKPPRKHECDELIDAYPNIFHNKEWSKIKVFVQNQYCKKK
nr:unnamed protein product [Callosobruchus analis]